MTQQSLDRAAEIAKQAQASFEQRKKEGVKPVAKEAPKGESKDAPADVKSTEKEKIEGNEVIVKTDDELIGAADESLNDDEKLKKAEVIKIREEAKTPEQKMEEWKASTQKRVDELVGELKSERNSRQKDQERIAELVEEIQGLKGAMEDSGAIESNSDKISKNESVAYDKMIEEDKALAREKRREMTKDELEEYLLEDYVSAQEWLVRRELRRSNERTAKMNTRDVAGQVAKNSKVLYERFPGCNVEERASELEAAGSSVAEIIDILSKESEDFKLMMEVMKTDKRYSDLKNPNAPLELMKAMEERKSGSGKEGKGKMYSEEEVSAAVKKASEEAIKKEQQRIGSIDRPLKSTITSPVDTSTQSYKDGLRVYLDAGKKAGKNWTEDSYKKLLEYRLNQNSSISVGGARRE